MFDLANLASCTELTNEHAIQAASSSVEMRTLLRRVAEIAQPGEGCPKVLMALAHLVGAEWVDGELRVELTGDEKSTQLIIITEHGVGIRERLLPAVRFNVPLDEFERALELAPRLVLPLRIAEENGTLVLTPLASPEGYGRSMALAEVAVDPTSLGDSDRTTSPPPADELQVVDEATPDDVAPASVHETSTEPPPADELQVVDEASPDDFPGALLNDLGGPPPPSGESKSEPRMESGPVPAGDDESFARDQRISNVHTRPTVRRMLAVDAAAVAALRRRDPRREEE